MDELRAGILYIPSELDFKGTEESFREAFMKTGAAVPLIVKGPAGAVDDVVSYTELDAEFTEALYAAMTRPISDRPCPYGPANGLHSPACFCNLSASAQETILWNELTERF